jgi:hypothetical protein
MCCNGSVLYSYQGDWISTLGYALVVNIRTSVLLLDLPNTDLGFGRLGDIA